MFGHGYGMYGMYGMYGVQSLGVPRGPQLFDNLVQAA